MVKVVKKEKAWDILVKSNREDLLKNFGTNGLVRIRDYFFQSVSDVIDVENAEVIEAYKSATVNGTYA